MAAPDSSTANPWIWCANQKKYYRIANENGTTVYIWQKHQQTLSDTAFSTCNEAQSSNPEIHSTSTADPLWNEYSLHNGNDQTQGAAMTSFGYLTCAHSKQAPVLEIRTEYQHILPTQIARDPHQYTPRSVPPSPEKINGLGDELGHHNGQDNNRDMNDGDMVGGHKMGTTKVQENITKTRSPETFIDL